MISEKYTKKDGTEREIYKFEVGDVVTFKKIFERETKFGKQFSMVTADEKFISLTGGQAKSLITQNVQEGDKLTAEFYENEFGKFVGIKVTHQDKVPSTQTALMKVPQDWVNFAKEYNEAVKGEGNSMHMLGAYVANKCNEEFRSIIELCKKNFQK